MKKSEALEVLQAKAWTRPDSYMGPDWTGCAVLDGRHRDSDTLERSNYRTILAYMQNVCRGVPEPSSEAGAKLLDFAGRPYPWVFDVRDSHWAVGWIEYILVRLDAPAAVLIAAAGVVDSLEEYPVFDESDWAELEHEEAIQDWDSWARDETIRGPFAALLAEEFGLSKSAGIDMAELVAQLEPVGGWLWTQYEAAEYLLPDDLVALGIRDVPVPRDVLEALAESVRESDLRLVLEAAPGLPEDGIAVIREALDAYEPQWPAWRWHEFREARTLVNTVRDVNKAIQEVLG